MYSYEERLKAVNLYIQYDRSYYPPKDSFSRRL